jgi:opacity protein-like surface antigen
MMANESGLYVGAELGSTHTNTATGATKYNITRVSEGLNLGYYLNENSRAYIAYTQVNADMNHDIPEKTKIYSAGYDYLFGTSALKPFIGGIIGYTTYKDGDFKITGMAYGVEAGVDYKLNNNISFDVGYRYLNSSAEATYSSDKSSMDSFQAFFIGAGYKF